MSPRNSHVIALVDLSSTCYGRPDLKQIELIADRYGSLHLLDSYCERLAMLDAIDQIVLTGDAQYSLRLQSTTSGLNLWMPSHHQDAARRAFEICQQTSATWVIFGAIAAPPLDNLAVTKLMTAARAHPETECVALTGGVTSHWLRVFHVHAIERLVDLQLSSVDDAAEAMLQHLNPLQLRLVTADTPSQSRVEIPAAETPSQSL